MTIDNKERPQTGLDLLDADDEKRARLHCIHHPLSQAPYVDGPVPANMSDSQVS